MKTALLNSNRLNFDGYLLFDPIEEVVNELIVYESTTPKQVIERSKGFEVLISKELLLNADTIQRLPKEVCLICEAGTGVDNIDIQAAKARNIQVCNVPDYSTSHVAQLTINFLLTMSSGLHRLRQYPATKRIVKPTIQSNLIISQVEGKILGVIGAGTIGKKVISLARALEMSVLVFSRTEHQWDDKFIRQVSLEEVLAKSQFLTLHCPLNKDTRHLLRNETISAMIKGSFIINTARGGLIDHDDLANALHSGHIAGAALDVQEPEPLPKSNALRSMNNVILTDHIGWKAIEAREKLINEVAKNIQEYIKVGKALNQVFAI